MKIKNFFIGLLAVLMGLTFSACNDDDDVPGLPKNTHRVISVINYYKDAPSHKYEFKYDGEDLVEVIKYNFSDQVYVLNGKYEITYDGNKATVISSEKDGEAWKNSRKWELTIENDLITKEEYYRFKDNAWSWNWKYIYSYSGNRMTYYKGYCSSDSPDEIHEDATFSYDNSKHLTKVLYTSLREDKLTPTELDSSFVHNGDNINEYIIYYYNNNTGNWSKNTKYEYSYSGEYVSSIQEYSWNENSQSWKPYTWGKTDYAYNENGFLITETRSNNRTEYEYEEGNGNAVFFMADWGALAPVYQMPTLKSQDVYKEAGSIFNIQKFRNKR